MPDRDWKLRIEDIIEAIQRIQSYTAGYELSSFTADLKTVDAVVRNMKVIREAARHIPPEIETKYAFVPWAEMRGMRNILLHEYFGVNVEILWQTVVNDLPPVISTLQRIQSEESQG